MATLWIDANDISGETLEFDVVGQPLFCAAFAPENGPGILSFAASQLGLPLLGGGVTQFRFVER